MRQSVKHRTNNYCDTIVHYDTCALSSPLLHGVKLGPERSEGAITPCNGLLKTLVSYNILYHSNLKTITLIWLFGSRGIKYGSKLVRKKIFSSCNFSHSLRSCEKRQMS